MSFSQPLSFPISVSQAYGLLSYEKAWRNRSPILAENGYSMRPRYDPMWVPSWETATKEPEECEDSIVLSPHYHVMDATRTADGRGVSIKIVDKSSNEIVIATFLSSFQDPMNHCVPILDVISDPVDSESSLLVMPYLRPFNRPAFEAPVEAIDFVEQTLEGLVFMHSQGVAHRDLSAANIMMDARSLYPHGHHPVMLDCAPNGQSEALCLRRTDKPVKYYFVDFGMSSRSQPGEEHLVLGTKGADKEPPELSNSVPYDAFMLDVFTLGNVYRKWLSSMLPGLKPLIDIMTAAQPSSRPDAGQALKMFRATRNQQGGLVRPA